MRNCQRSRCAGLGATIALFFCALTWSSDSLASCGQHPGTEGARQVIRVAHFEYASLIFGSNSARDLVMPPTLAGVSCPGRSLPDMPPSIPSTSLRVEPWVPLPSAPPAAPASRPLFAGENRHRARVCHASIDRPPRTFAAA